LNSSSATTTSASAPKKSKLGGLGAKKAASPLDFAEAERKAAEEAERIKQLGYDRLKEEEEERAKAKSVQESLQAASRNVGVIGKVTSTTPVVAASKPRGNAQDMERLGMGMKKMGFGAVPAAASASVSTRYILCS
jgi:ADP-ribosylation factor GTPase-activating protein 2/3